MPTATAQEALPPAGGSDGMTLPTLGASSFLGNIEVPIREFPRATPVSSVFWRKDRLQSGLAVASFR
jgi:hypothetical protein